MSRRAANEPYNPKPQEDSIFAGRRSLVKFTMPDHKAQAKMVHDADGKVINIGSLVTNHMVIDSSAETGNVPVGTVLYVEAKAGAGFILVDTHGTRHISMGARLRVVKEGSIPPELAPRPTQFDPFGVEPGVYAKRGALATAKATKGTKRKKKA